MSKATFSASELDSLLEEVGELDGPYGHRVLVVDESKTLRLRLKVLLEEQGYDAEEASDAFEAVSQVALYHPDIILINSALPDLDGTRLSLVLKQHPDFKHIPVVLMSQQQSVFDEARWKLSGAEGVLKKPFKDDELLVLLQQLLKPAIRRL